LAGKRTVEIRFPTKEGRTVVDELGKLRVRGCERVVLALAGLSITPRAMAVLVSSPHPVPDNSYEMTDMGSAWDPRFTAKIAEEALRRRLGMVVIHRHSFGAQPRLSQTDETSFVKMLPALKALLPERPHGSIVIKPDGATGGKIWFPDGIIRDVTRVRWLGSPLEIMPRQSNNRGSDELYKSQVDLIGEEGQRRLVETCLGVIGLGGGGSHVVQQASRAGFGKLVLVDDDQVEKRNRSRTVGTKSSDEGKPKLQPMKRLVSEASKAVAVVGSIERFPGHKSIVALKDCDLVISCVDTFSARSEVMKFAWRYMVPLIDIGVGTHTKEEGSKRRLDRLAGHVHVYLPGEPCMWCSRLLTQKKIELETGGRPEYLRGRGGPGQVISFNGVVASLAVTEAMHLITGMLQGGSRRRFLLYDGLTPSIHFEDPTRKSDCLTCSTELGAGEP
jgi:molybdopterin-synthase adenylyltransferase